MAEEGGEVALGVGVDGEDGVAGCGEVFAEQDGGGGFALAAGEGHAGDSEHGWLVVEMPLIESHKDESE